MPTPSDLPPVPPEKTGPVWERWTQLLREIVRGAWTSPVISFPTISNPTFSGTASGSLTSLSLTTPAIASPTFSGAWSGSLTNISGTNIKDSTRCYAVANKTTAQTLVSGSVPVIDFNNVVHDSRSTITTGAAWKFTVPAGHGGMYLVSAQMLIERLVGTVDIELQLYRNGSGLRALGYRRWPGSLGLDGINGSTLALLSAGDYIDVRTYTGGAGDQSVWVNSFWNHISIIRLVTDL